MSEKAATCTNCGYENCQCDANADAIRIIREIVDANGGESVPFIDDAVKHCIAAAEERGRRRGVEERDGLRERVEAAQRALGGFNYIAWASAGGEPECEHGYFIATPCRACDVEFVRTGKARVALAPRDSGKVFSSADEPFADLVAAKARK